MPNINIVESNTSGGGGGSGSSGGELPTEPSPALSSVRASTHDDGDDSFPYHGLKSTTDAGVDVFRSQNPQTFDGRGVVIAIIDSGVDPSVEGLRTTTTGLPKVVDIVDCTGTGDVNTSTVREEMLVLDGLSGRTLILGRDWVNPTGVYHVGVTWLKAFAPHRFFQDKLLPAYMNTQSQRTTAIKHDIELRLQRLSATASTGSDAAIEIEELRARLKVLDHFESQYRESGPVCDCAVFHDGKVWRAAIDLDETGDLRNVPLMTDYSREYQWPMPVFSVNIYDNGRLLSIVTQSSDHGTHVAGIAAAYHPDSPELNGIAPGAQLVSINISDCRIPGEETSLSVIRALRAVERCAASGLGCHIVNMSFSESVRNTPGRCEFIAQLADELMRNGHHIFVASAGNNGPGMSSVSAPGGVTSSCIGVGAYLGQAEIDACYGMVGGGSTLSSGPYTFSSRGPFADGCQGVNLYAPGGALSCQPRFFDGKLGHLSGTSMAAPYASGAIALLLSGMMQTGMHWSYPRIRRALIQTSRPLNSNDDVDGSCGLLQVQPAWEYLCEFRDNPILDISFDTKVTCDRKSSRGIYLRELYEFEFLAQNGAQAAMSGNGGGGGSSSASSDSGMSRSPGPASGVRFIRLVSTQPWAVVPRHVYMTAAGCNFNISVNSPVLAAGSAHFASVLGYDSSESEHLGPLFSIPVTACRPLEMGDSSRLDLDPIYFEPGSIFRSFVAVPEHALYATVTTTAYNDAPAQDSARFVFSYLQLVAHDTAADHHTYLEKEMFHGSHGDGRSDSQVFRDRVPLCGGHTLEITVAPKWSGRQSCRLGLQIEFGGVAVVGGQSPSRRGAVSMNTAAGYTRLDLYAGVKREEAVWPVASLSHWRRTLLPRSHSIMVVDDIRDTHLAPSSHLLYELCLVYSLQHSSDYSATYRLTAPALEGMMYDAWHSGSLLHVYDCNGQLLHTQSARSSLFSLDKRGEYSVKLLVRHRD
ncbi:subtilisin-like protein, partial [Ramicandelaber brevisporus]